MKKTVNAENEKLLYSYHTQLVSLYDEKIGSSELHKKGARKKSNKQDFIEYFLFPSGFGDLLVDLEKEDEVKRNVLYAVGGGTRDEQSIDFGHLLIVLSRAIPLVDMVVKRICDMNVGIGVTGDGYSIHSMKEALIWLSVKANDSRSLAYYDIEKLQPVGQCACGTDADDLVDIVEVEQFIGINADGRHAHAAAHDGDFFPFIGTGIAEHIKHTTAFGIVF